MLKPNGAPVILVTGGTGLVGTALVAALATRFPDCTVIALARHAPLQPLQGAEFLHADLRRANLGLSDCDAAGLRQRTRAVMHCAASTNFGLPLEEARRLNVGGTERVLAFAATCPRLEHLAHISTLYIAGRRPGSFGEAPLQHAEGYFNSYEQSKHEAEDLMLQHASRLPVSVVRLSSVVDPEGKRGHISQLLRLLPHIEAFPCLPARPEVPVDLITSDWAGAAIAALAGETGTIAHVCAGAARSTRADALLDYVFGVWESRTGVRVKRPRLVDSQEFEREMRRLPAGSAARRAMASMQSFLPHLSIEQPFDCGRTTAVLDERGIYPESILPRISAILDHWFPSESPRMASPALKTALA